MTNQQEQKILAGLKPEYRRFFAVSERVTSAEGKPVLLVQTEHFESFLLQMKADDNISTDTKVLVAILISGAARVSEGLGVRRCDLHTDAEGNVFFQIKVLKKRRDDVTRNIIIHPAVADLVLQYAKTKRGFDRLFDFTSAAALKRVKRAFGLDDTADIDCHAFRHAGISRQIFGLGFSTEKVAKLQKLSTRMVEAYTHLNEKEALKELFTKKGA